MASVRHFTCVSCPIGCELDVAIDDAGNLVFKEDQKLASEQTFSSYGWNRFSDSKPVMGAYRGIGEVYVQPKLTRK